MRKVLLAAALLATSGAPALAYDEFLGEVRAMPYLYCPKDWVRAGGQILPIAGNTALFSLLGTRYGGDGRTTFALPNLSGTGLVQKDEHERAVTDEKVNWCIAVKGNYPPRD